MMSRIGRFCFRRRGWVLVAWLLFFLVGGASAGPLMGAISSASYVQGLESDEGQHALTEGRDHGRRYVAVIEGVDGNRPAISRAVSEVRGIPGVREVAPPKVATDRSGVAVEVTLDKADDQSGPLTRSKERLSALSTDLPGTTVRFGGIDLIADDTNTLAQADLTNAMLYSLPVTLLVLLFVFGGLRLAAMPVIGAVVTIATSFGLMLLASNVIQIDNTVLSVVDLLGLGLSIDYALLLLARYREELAVDRDPLAAIGRTWATAGRTILFSALTVAAALISLVVIQQPRLQTMGASGIVASLLAMAVALTLLPALVGFFGKKVKPARNRHADVERGMFARIARVTQRRPRLVVGGALAVLVLAGLPLAQLNLRMTSVDSVPRSVESLQVEQLASQRYGLTSNPPMLVVAETDPAALDTWARGLSAPGIARVEPARQQGEGLSSVAVLVHGDAQGPGAKEVLDHLRANRPPGVQSWVTGETAGFFDLRDRTISDLPLAVLVAVLAMLILLFLMTGSVVAALLAVVMNIVSLSATFGVLVLVFQNGLFAGVLDTIVVNGLSIYLLLTLFAFGFAFAMDYHVFLLSRIKEAVDEGRPNDLAVRHGLQRSGRLITLAVVAMMIVFAAFGMAEVGDIEQLGIGLFVAVIVDGTIVRCLLVPGAMTLLGRHNWWSPAPLRRLHARFGLREHEGPAPVRHDARV